MSYFDVPFIPISVVQTDQPLSPSHDRSIQLCEESLESLQRLSIAILASCCYSSDRVVVKAGSQSDDCANEWNRNVYSILFISNSLKRKSQIAHIQNQQSSTRYRSYGLRHV